MAQPKQDSGKKLFVVSTHMLKKSDFNGNIELLPKTTTLLTLIVEEFKLCSTSRYRYL